MAHAITQRKNGFNEMAYVGEKPWHGLGQELKEDATIEEWLVAAGMDWKIQRSKVRYATNPNGTNGLREWDDWHVLMRSDSKDPLGMVSDGYKVVQPREALEFFRDLVEAAGFRITTAGTLHGGRKFWAMADIGAEDRVVGKDLVKGRVLVASSCDGSMKSRVKNCAERVVCANTLAVALGETGSPYIEISHRTKFDAAKIKAELGLTVDSFVRFIANARKLAKFEMKRFDSEVFLTNLLEIGDPKEDELKVRLEAAREDKKFQKILELYHGKGRGASLPGVTNTLWGLVNAVTEYVDHHARARNDSNRMDSAWFGAGDALKTEAMQRAVDLVEA